MITNLLLLLLCASLINGAPAEDEVHFAIPVYTNHKWYSGYLNFSTGHYHYVFFDSQRDPDNDPVVLWLNGGPGCSSLIGMAIENGPFVFETNKTNFKKNQYSWNNNTNMLYLQSPGGVGFSKSFRNNTYNDTTATQDSYRALVDFFRKFPNLKKNQFYITGESYAGIYVPYLARYILQMNALPNTEVKINLKGIMIGNACTDVRECFEPSGGANQNGMSIYQYQFLHGHGYITDGLYQRIQGACTLGYSSAECKRLRNITDHQFAETKTVINNIYQPCYYQTIGDEKLQQSDASISKKIVSGTSKMTQSRVKNSLGAYVTCEDLQGILTFFNEPSIHIHLHVDFVNYDICSDEVADKYRMNSNASEWIYPYLIRAGLKILVYSGDVDANVPITGTLRWIERMKDVEGIPVVEPWREWWVKGLHKYEDQVGGMVWKLRGFTFASVRGAGHLVPADKRKQALVLFQSFIFNRDLPQKEP